MRAKSVTIRETTFGWRTLTATSRPCSVARWICAIDPEASGFSSKDSKPSLSGTPSAASTSRLVYGKSCTGALEWSWASWAQRASGNMSGRHAAHCPHLMKAVPALARQLFTSQNQTLVRNGLMRSAIGAVNHIGRNMKKRVRPRATSAPGPGGDSSTSIASSRAPSTSRRGGGRPRSVALRASARLTPDASTSRVRSSVSRGGASDAAGGSKHTHTHSASHLIRGEDEKKWTSARSRRHS
jgi:hypothetical protein